MSVIGNLLLLLAKKWVKILIAPSFRLKFDEVTLKLSLVVLYIIFFYKLNYLSIILLYAKFFKIECRLHD